MASTTEGAGGRTGGDRVGTPVVNLTTLSVVWFGRLFQLPTPNCRPCVKFLGSDPYQSSKCNVRAPTAIGGALPSWLLARRHSMQCLPIAFQLYSLYTYLGTPAGFF